MEELKVEGLVINKEEVNENDRIITIFEENRGKIKVLIKGIRKSKNREIYASDILVLGDYILKKKGEYFYNTSLQLKNPFFSIKSNFFKLELSLYILIVIDKITFENIESKKLYKLVINTLNAIQEEKSKNKILIILSYFFYKILCYEGFKISTGNGLFFNLKEGSIQEKVSEEGILLFDYQKEYLKRLISIDIKGLYELELDNNKIISVISILENFLNYNLFLELNIKKHLGEEKWI